MRDGSLAFVLLVYAAAMLFIAALWIYPAAQRARFTRRIAEIRNDVVEAQLTGRIADTDCVNDFIEKAEFLIDNPRALTLHRLYAVHAVHERHGITSEHSESLYGSLSPEQKAFMEEQDDAMIEAITMRVLLGSRFALLIEVAYWTERGVRTVSRLITGHADLNPAPASGSETPATPTAVEQPAGQMVVREYGTVTYDNLVVRHASIHHDGVKLGRLLPDHTRNLAVDYYYADDQDEYYMHRVLDRVG